MGRKATVVLLVCAVLAAGAATGASAVKSNLLPPLQATLGIAISPKALSKKSYTPVIANVEGKVTTSDGTHPPALREMTVDVDRDVAIDVRGLPACDPGPHLDPQDTPVVKKACGPSTVGRGIAHVEIAFPEQSPILLPLPITIFNGGESGGKVKLLIYTFLTVPAPAAIVTRVTIERRGSGLHSIAKVPVIAGGSGSLLDFKFKLGRKYAYKGVARSFLAARCPDDAFKVKAGLFFRNEAHTPGAASTTAMSGNLSVPCAPS